MRGHVAKRNLQEAFLSVIQLFNQPRHVFSVMQNIDAFLYFRNIYRSAHWMNRPALLPW